MTDWHTQYCASILVIHECAPLRYSVGFACHSKRRVFLVLFFSFEFWEASDSKYFFNLILVKDGSRQHAQYAASLFIH